jgi:hypothetical protein
MINETKQTAVDFIFSQLPVEYGTTRSGYFDVYQQAKEMEIADKEKSYAEGYAEGYKRALELIEWMIKTEIKRNK